MDNYVDIKPREVKLYNQRKISDLQNSERKKQTMAWLGKKKKEPTWISIYEWTYIKTKYTNSH